MEVHAKEFMATTSAHGFGHLVEEKPKTPKWAKWIERIFWGIAIMAAFTASIYYIISASEAVRRNPIAKDIEYIPPQDAFYPSVTIPADRVGFGRLKLSIMNQLTYSCPEYGDSDDKAAEECARRSAAGRNLVYPLARALVSKMFKWFTEKIETEEKSTEEDIRRDVCFFYTVQEVETLIFNQLVESLTGPDHRARRQDTEMFMDKIAELIRTPWDLFEVDMAEMLHGYPHSDMSWSDCKTRRFDGISLRAKAMLLLTIRVISDKSTMSVGHWYQMSLRRIDESSASAFKENFRDLQGQVLQGMENLVQADNITLAGMLEYLDLVDYAFDLGTTAGVNLDEKISEKHYREVLQVAKYSMRPLEIKMTEKARVRDMEESFLSAINSTYGRRGPSSYINHFPTLLDCKFDNKKDSEVCQNPMTAFTMSGLGFSFNARRFFQQYQRSDCMETFCDEITERIDQEMCSTDSIEGDQMLAAVNEKTGKEHSLRLLLHTPQKVKLLEDDHDDWYFQKVAIHSPYSVADTTSSNIIEPTVGTHTTVVVTQRITIPDDSLLDLDRSVRGCHSQERDGNPLKVFRNYTKDNCKFECYLERSMKVCGCVPWNFPKLHQDTRTCSGEGSVCFHEAMKNSDEVADCPDCIESCYNIEYEFTTHTKPLKDICKDDKDIQEAINQVINDGQFSTFRDAEVDRKLSQAYLMRYRCLEYVKKNAALVEVRFRRAKVVQITARARVTLPEQMANIGGTVALFTGGSVFTPLEFVVFLLKMLGFLALLFCIRLWLCCRGCWRRRWRWRRNRVAPLRRGRLFV